MSVKNLDHGRDDDGVTSVTLRMFLHVGQHFGK